MNINDNVTNLHAYFEDLAKKHKSILHTDQKKHFFKGGIEDFFTGLKNKVKFPAIVFDGFELNYNGDGDDIEKDREFSFIVVQEYSTVGNVDQIAQATSDCERIGEDFIKKILDDIENSSCMFSFRCATGILMENTNEKSIGMQFTCNLTSKFNTKINTSTWAQ